MAHTSLGSRINHEALGVAGICDAMLPPNSFMGPTYQKDEKVSAPSDIVPGNTKC